MDEIKFREIKDKEDFDVSAIYSSFPFVQSFLYSQWQKSYGRKLKRFVIEKDKEVIGFCQVVVYPLFFGKNYLYVPYGPVIKEENITEDFIDKLQKHFLSILKSQNAVFVKFDFCPKPLKNSTLFLLEEKIGKSPFYASHSSNFQPRNEWALNLESLEKDLLSSMRTKTRYNIGLAKKRGVKIEIKKKLINYFDDFYGLLKTTAQRADFNLHPKKYYQKAFETTEKDKNFFLVIAKYKKEILVINFIVLFGDTAYFIFGGSSGEHKDKMASYLAHWEGILYAKKLGFHYYNFGGVVPDLSKIVQGENNDWQGLSRFKKGFGGEMIFHSDFYDLVLNRFWYYLYNLRKFLKYKFRV